MSRLPDHFDLLVRRARQYPDPLRQADFVLGALAGLVVWHFINLGTKDRPQAAKTEIESEMYLLVFSDIARLEDALHERVALGESQPLPVISIPAEVAMAWCIECRMGLFLNPPDDGVLISFGQIEIFHREWQARAGQNTTGFWIPNMSSEEEDFWQEHGY